MKRACSSEKKKGHEIMKTLRSQAHLCKLSRTLS
jgi:hypothetical protein